MDAATVAPADAIDLQMTGSQLTKAAAVCELTVGTPVPAITGMTIVGAVEMSSHDSFTKIHTHLFLVYDEVLPHLTPALDPRFCPCRVFLLSSPATTEQVEKLTIILKGAGVTVFAWDVDDLWDFDHVRERILAFVAQHGETELALNVSDGTKPACLAAYEIFRELGRPVYFVHPERDQVIWIYPSDQEDFDLADKIKLHAFYAAHGMRIVSCKKKGIPLHRQELTYALVKGVDRFMQPLGTLNAFASMSEGTLLSPCLNQKQITNSSLIELIELFSNKGLLKLTPTCQLEFASEEARFYANGGWLEEHVFDVLFNLRMEIPIIQDIARSLQIEWDEMGSPVKNEIDVAFLADNRLYVVECKTKKFSRDNMPHSPSAEILYKLDALRDHCGGEGARALLVSYRRVQLPMKQRAEEFGIEISDGTRIRNLEEQIRQWIYNPLLEQE